MVTTWYLNIPPNVEGSLLRLHLGGLVGDVLEATIKFNRTLQATIGRCVTWRGLRIRSLFLSLDPI